MTPSTVHVWFCVSCFGFVVVVFFALSAWKGTRPRWMCGHDQRHGFGRDNRFSHLSFLKRRGEK